MKYLAFIFPILFVFAAAPAYAATLSLAPTTVSVTAGQSFSVAVEVNADTSQVVTAQAELNYPSNILEATSFTFAPTWIQLSEPGYDQMGNGTIIKTGGYPSGFTGTQRLGTITFVAEETGTATITVSNSSNVYNTQGANIMTAPLGSSQVVVAAPAPASTPAAAITQTTTTVTSTTTTAAPGSSVPSGTSSQAAAVATALPTGSSSIPTWVWVVVAVIVLAGLGWWFYPRSAK